MYVDEPHSSVVSAYWEDGDTLSATIHTSSDVFTIEVCTATFNYLVTSLLSNSLALVTALILLKVK